MRGVRRRWGRYGALLLGMWIAGCSSSATEADEELRVDDIVGTWEWESSTGGIAGMTRTPETEGFERTLVVTDDFQMELYQGAELVGSTTFTLGRAEEGQALVPITVAEPFFDFTFGFVEIDFLGRLTLADPCCDGFVHVLVTPDGS